MEAIYSFKHFLSQLELFEENAEKLHIDKEDYEEKDKKILDINFLIYILYERKIIEFSNDNPESKFVESISDERKEQTLELTDLLIERDKFAKKIYETLNVEEDDEGLGIWSDIPGLTTFIRNRAEEDEGLDLLTINQIELKSILINMCISFESLVLNILKEYFLYAPNPQLNLKKSITYEELLLIGDIDSAKDYLIDIQLDDLFRKNFLEWIDQTINMLSAKKNKIYIEKQLTSLSEMYQRRHIFVHNNGIVNSQYLKNTNSNKYNENDKIDISITYIKEKIKDLKFVSWFIIDAYLKRHYQSNGEAFTKMNSLLVDYIDEECEAIPLIFKNYSESSSLDEEAEKIANVNYFLYYKFNGGLENYEKELDKFHTNHLSEDFQIAKVILSEDEDCLQKLENYIERLDDSDFFAIFDWPLLRATNDTEKVSDMMNKKLKKIIGE